MDSPYFDGAIYRGACCVEGQVYWIGFITFCDLLFQILCMEAGLMYVQPDSWSPVIPLYITLLRGE